MDTYEKKYKEALERAKDSFTYPDYPGFIRADVVFPELAESEDERIRKALLEMVHDTTGDELWVDYNVHKEDALAWLEKQGESSDKIHYWTEEEIEPIISDYLRGTEHYGGMIARLRCLKPKSLEKQGESYTKRDVDNAYLEGMAFAKNELEKQGEVESDNDDIEVEEKGIREAFNKIEDEKQCKQKPQRMISAEAKEAMYNKPADTVEQKFKVKYAGSEYNVLDIKDIAGVAFYVIEDEPNHIDYVKAENCEIIDGYAIKENGSPYPTKSAVFFGAKNPTWSKEDEYMLESIVSDFAAGHKSSIGQDKWLKSLKGRYTWKPSDEQLEALKDAIRIKPLENPSDSILWRLYEQLKKLKS